MSTLNYIDENGNINKVGVIPQNVIDKVIELDAKVNRGSVSVTADGVKTYKQLFNGMHSLIDYSKISFNSKLVVTDDTGKSVLNVFEIHADSVFFNVTNAIKEAPWIKIYSAYIASTSSYYDTVNGSYTSHSNDIPSSGTTITLYY